MSSAAEFLAKGPTPHILRAVKTHNSDGTGGWEVVLSLDGYYRTREDAVRLAGYWFAQAQEAGVSVERGEDAPDFASAPDGPGAPERRLAWTCDVCQGTVDRFSGYLTVHRDEILEWEEADRQYRERRPVDPMGGQTLREILEAPEPVRWRVYHAVCDPRPDGVGYDVSVERAGTPSQLIGWTLHIHGKGWLDATDWSEFLERHGLGALS